MRGGGPLVSIMGEHPTILRTSLTPGGGHGGTVNSYSDVTAMLGFISDVFADPPPPPPSTFLEVAELSILDPWGRRLPLTL